VFAILLAVRLLAPSLAEESGGAPASAPAKQIRHIDIDQKKVNEVHQIFLAVGQAAKIDFPEPFARAPVCGNCGPEALFLFQAAGNDSFVLKPRLSLGKQLDGSEINATDYQTQLYVTLESKISLTLQVSIVAERERADTNVVFRLPGRAAETAYVQRQMEKFKATLEAGFAARVALETTREMMRGFAGPHECTPSQARTREGDVVLEIKEVCRLGARGFVRFAVENRDDSPFAMGDVELSGVSSEGAEVPLEEDPPIYAPRRQLEPASLSADKSKAQASVIVTFPLPAAGPQSFHRLHLRLKERAGKLRELHSRFGLGF
jgi:hypothetical protein